MSTPPVIPAWAWPGPVMQTITLETGRANRRDNMVAFAFRALQLMRDSIKKAAPNAS